jgi:2-polyprenyl-6-methoxyphenol hydroxylase-like FAD-dependent oxidoreductase
MSRSVVVLGAGPAGAAAALFLARRGHRVTILDGDSPPPPPQRWRRDGAPHARQGHSFLALGTRVIREEAPDVFARMIDVGGERVPLRYAPDDCNFFVRREIFDAVWREALQGERGVSLVGSAATGLMVKRSSTAVPHVLGVTTEHAEITADLVIDAAGRRSPVHRWLARHGIELQISEQRVAFVYVTRHYRLPTGAAFPSTRVPIVAALDYATALAFPEDAGHYQLTVQLDTNDPSRRALLDPATFERFLMEVPLIAAWLSAGSPIGDPELSASPGNCRKAAFASGPRVTGLLLLGDAAVRTNPTAGRGVAMALVHARAVSELLSAPDGPIEPVALLERWEDTTTRLLGPWLENQAQIDSGRKQEYRATLEGRSGAAVNDVSGKLASALYSPRDSVMEQAAEKLFNLLVTPQELARDRNLMRHLFRESRRSQDSPERLGPDRAGFLDLVSDTPTGFRRARG